MHSFCIKEIVGKIRKALAGCGSDSFRSGGCCCGYPLYTGSRTCRSCYDSRCADLPVFRRIALHSENKSICKRKGFLCYCIPSESNGTGSNWLCSLCSRIAVRKHCTFRSCYGNYPMPVSVGSMMLSGMARQTEYSLFFRSHRMEPRESCPEMN